jgi:hypothetical protein
VRRCAGAEVAGAGEEDAMVREGRAVWGRGRCSSAPVGEEAENCLLDFLISGRASTSQSRSQWHWRGSGLQHTIVLSAAAMPSGGDINWHNADGCW